MIDFVIRDILSNQDKIWNSVEMYDVYIEYGGHQHVPSNKNRLVNRISELLHDKVSRSCYAADAQTKSVKFVSIGQL